MNRQHRLALADVHQEGVDACLAGAAVDANPHPRGTPERGAWRDGWYAADRAELEPQPLNF